VQTATGAVTYSELGARTAAVATILRAAGVGPDVAVGIALGNSVEFIVWLFGTLEAGGIAVPLDPRLSARETHGVLDAAGVGILAGRTDLDPAKTAGWTVSDEATVAGTGVWHRPRPAINAPRPPSGSGESFVLRHFSSGSTGRPKHILRTAGQVMADYRSYGLALDLGADDRFLGCPPFYHAFGSTGLFATLAHGGATYPLSRFLPAEVLAAARTFQPTLFLVTPPMVDMLGRCVLRAEDHAAFRSLRHCLCATAPLSRAAHDAFRDRFGVSVGIQYGSTEALCATLKLDGDFVEGAVGHGIPGVEVRIFDDDGRSLPPGAIGRVGIRSAGACTAYASADDVLERIDGHVFPGDKGRLDDDGCLHVMGRDDVYNIGGYKVDRCEVEAVIRSGFPVRFVAVLPYVRAGQPALRAVIEADCTDVTPPAVVALCRDKLSDYKVPARVDVVDALPRDANGKILAGTVGDP
jgi:long-chain acyl-CoA synthetase